MISRKRSVIVLMLLVALLLAACGGGEEEVNPPAVQIQVGEQVYAPPAYSYCWPQATDNWDCELKAVAQVQPVPQINVVKGDEVKFIIADEAGTVDKFTATVLDGPGGVQDLGQGPQGVFDPSLIDGLYRVQVDVEYSSVNGVELKPGDEPYVSYVFGLQIAGIVLPTPTTTPTATPTDTPTPTATFTPTNTPTPTATFTPTSTPTNTPTNTPTSTPTNTPTPTDTSTPTNTPTEKASNTPKPTVEEPTETPRAGVTERPTATEVAPLSTEPLGTVELGGTVRLVSGSTTVTVAGATVSFSYTSTVAEIPALAGSAITDANGQFTFETLELFASDQIMITAQAPGYEAQSIQLTGAEAWDQGGAVDFVLELAGATSTDVPTAIPTQLPIATQTPQPAPPPTEPPATTPQVPPLTLNIAGRDYQPTGYEFCERAGTGEQVCVKRPADGESRRINLLRGTSMQLSIGGERPQEVSIQYLDTTGTPTGQPEIRLGDNRLLLVVTPETGSYIMVINVKWSENEATYFFQVAVSD